MKSDKIGWISIWNEPRVIDRLGVGFVAGDHSSIAKIPKLVPQHPFSANLYQSKNSSRGGEGEWCLTAEGNFEQKFYISAPADPPLTSFEFLFL